MKNLRLWILLVGLAAAGSLSACATDFDLPESLDSTQEGVRASGCTRDQAEDVASLMKNDDHGGGRQACTTCHVDEPDPQTMTVVVPADLTDVK